jgi:DNA replication protein DnaC
MLRPVPGAGDDRPDPGERTACVLGICDGSGWILRDDDLAEPCACRERMIGRAASRGMGTGIPKKFRGVGFDRKPIVDLNPFVLREIRVFIEQLSTHIENGRGLWLMGDVGTGKTSVAMLVAQQAELAGHSVAVYSTPSLLAEIRSTFDRDSSPSYMDLFRRLCAVDLLVLDDLGTENRTEWVLEQLYAIVNERWQDERSIIVTSNETDLDSLRDQLGPRTVSRLVEISGERLLPIHGPDLRVQHPN